MRKRYLLVGLAALTLTVIFARYTVADSAVEGRAGRAEMRFLEGMIDHHQMALDMANDCLGKAETEQVQTLCQNIIEAQTSEITTMQMWLLEWYNVQYVPVSMTDEAAVDSMNHGAHTEEGAPVTDPAMTMGMMAGLGRLEGHDYEIAFLEAMIDHHDDALHMAERILERATEGIGHVQLRELAQTIIEDQTAEIEQMETLIMELSSQQ
jgi:uncharacterized protein (DUF305 family)